MGGGGGGGVAGWLKLSAVCSNVLPLLIHPPARPTGLAALPACLPRLQDGKTADAHKGFALLCIGELGRQADLTGSPALSDALSAALGSGPPAAWVVAGLCLCALFAGISTVRMLLLEPPHPSCAASPAESTAESASTALAGVAAGNVYAYLPLLLQHLYASAMRPKQQYLLLQVGGWVGGWTGRGGAGLSGTCWQVLVQPNAFDLRHACQTCDIQTILPCLPMLVLHSGAACGH